MWLEQEMFKTVVASVPLVSVDVCLVDNKGRLLVGLRNNAPAQHFWFTPGGRVHKNELLPQALSRVALEELNLTLNPAQLSLMGAWDHIYSDSIFGEQVSTHYVNLPYWQRVTDDYVHTAYPLHQHRQWQWRPLLDVAHASDIHPYVQVNAQWLLKHG